MTAPAGHAALSSQQLQAHYDEVCSCMPVLQLSILPKSLASSLAAHSFDAATLQIIKKASAGLQECQVCSCHSEGHRLQLLLSTRLHFHNRAAHITAARFACAQCTAVSDCSLLLQLLTPAVGCDQDADRSEALQRLCLHFAALNNAPPSVTSNPDSLALWVQELAVRAYGLAVVANSLRGWSLQPPGTPLQQLLQGLLQPQSKKAAAAAAGGGGGGGAAAVDVVAGKQRKQKKAVLAGAAGAAGQQLQQSTPAPAEGPGTTKKRRKSLPSSTAAAAAAAAAAEPAIPSEAPTSKKHKKKQASAAAAAATGSQQVTPADKKQHHQHQQLQGSTQKQRKPGATPSGGVTAPVRPKPSQQQHSNKPGAGAAMHTPQQVKPKSSSSRKLKSAPR